MNKKDLTMFGKLQYYTGAMRFDTQKIVVNRIWHRVTWIFLLIIIIFGAITGIKEHLTSALVYLGWW